jgi:septal ring factor EnvC (AmiA/AmiB activator)
MSNDEMTTKPTMGTLLARLDEWGARLTNELTRINAGQEEFRKGQDELRAALNAGLRRVERKIEILNDNLLTIKADIRDLEARVEKIESEQIAKS